MRDKEGKVKVHGSSNIQNRLMPMVGYNVEALKYGEQ